MDRITEAFRNFNERHERVKKYVHTAWRVPLPKWGQAVMGCIYFSIPVIGGWHVMQWAIGNAHKSIGPKGEYLEVKEVQGIGQVANVNGEQKRVGAGGLGMGVKLAVSDKEDQERSKKMLAKMLRQNRRRKKEREEEQNKAATDEVQTQA
ncbi:hypothetical protein CTEN210_11602 [Chaetoceros tenuissimus]|uniref:Uncharacterized protein n=1 Tax=Chaetoceros tenuissimus TaxID=426638 RepID=A0AAD3H9F8_9STRA|nr:hypothetical protein CTEN210_11602 [Chaetoceros tenuissimus]